jgi:predicted amidohydrolase YtcJ
MRTVILAMLGVVVASTAAITGSPDAATGAVAPGATPTEVYFNGRVVTMDARGTTAQAIAVANGRIVAVGSNHEILRMVRGGTRRVNLAGGTMLPGFIDPHSHMAGYGAYLDTQNWIDLSSINGYFKPPPGDRRCRAPQDPQVCFIPVRNQDDVDQRLAKRVAEIKANPATPVPYALGANYDVSRLGHSQGCSPPDAVGFQCPNLEDGHARERLDAISPDIPIYVAAQTGHFGYANTPALQLLNICGVLGAVQPCYQATTNPQREIALANMGQLDEDLALYGDGFFIGKTGALPRTLPKAAEIYAQHGYTLVQEGAAPLDLMALYDAYLSELSPLRHDFPVSAAMLAYESKSADFGHTIAAAVAARALAGENPLFSVAGVKTFVDGSPQGYTAYLNQPYREWFFPFTDPSLFPQPYRGLPDLSRQRLEERLIASHAAGFPMVVHEIGDGAITMAVDSLVATRSTPPPPGKRDVVLHAFLITPSQLSAVNRLGTAAVSVMPSNVHFFALPECQQILGPNRTINGYPARSALEKTGRVTFHTDSPVTPPDPLFAIWSGVTRRVQQPAWYPNRDPNRCPPVAVDNSRSPGDQRVSVRDGIRAFTVDAAWQYGMEDIRGTLEVGKYADMVILSADPLSRAIERNPDALKNVRVLGTVRYGRHFPNPKAHEPPIWPA